MSTMTSFARSFVLLACVLFTGTGASAQQAQPVSLLDGGDTAPATMPAGTVIGLVRRSLPQGPTGPTVETGEISSGAPCAQGVAECLNVSPTVLAALYAQLRVRVRHGPAINSPHYGALEVYARWPGGRCVVSDTREAPAIESDRAAFSAAFDAVMRAIAEARRRDS